MTGVFTFFSITFFRIKYSEKTKKNGWAIVISKKPPQSEA